MRRIEQGAILDPFDRLKRRAPVVVLASLFAGRRNAFVVGEGERGPPDAIFEIGSITKTFTALLLAEMVDRGEVSISDPLSKFVPDGDANPALRAISLRDLATHTARLQRVPRDLLWQALRNRANPYAGYDRHRLEHALGRIRQRRGIGRRFRYSNFGFAALGYVLERASGVDYGQLVVRRVCEPLGLASTSPTPWDGHATRYLPGHKKIGKAVSAWELSSFAPAGVLKSSAADMLTYLEAHLQPEGAALANALQEVQMPKVQIKRGRLAVGLGWLIVNRRGEELVWHNGATGGFSSFVGFNRRSGAALVALANARVAGPLTRLGLNALARLSSEGGPASGLAA